MSVIQKAVKDFKDSVIGQTEALKNSDYKTGNRFARKYMDAFSRLVDVGDEGRDALAELFTHPRQDVKVMAAVCLLRYRHQEASAILRKAARGEGLVAFGAEQALKRWEEGTWQLDPAEPPEPSQESGKPEAPSDTRTGRKGEIDLAVGDSTSIEAIKQHIEHFVGPIESVFHEIVSDLVHIDLHWVKPTAERPFHTLVTSGMSDRPMSPPRNSEQYKFLELVLNLPASWPMDSSDWTDDTWYWPVQLLKTLARFPHEHQTWLWAMQTVRFGDLPEPFHPSTRQCGALIVPSVTLPEKFMKLELDEDRQIYFFSALTLYPEELSFGLRQGPDALLDRFDRAGVLDVVDPSRENVCGQKV